MAWPLLDTQGKPWREFPESERQKFAYEELAQDRPGNRRHHLIVLNDYQAANLRALLYAVETGEIEGWDNGDWVGEIPWRLPSCETLGAQGPNRKPRPMDEVYRERFPQYYSR